MNNTGSGPPQAEKEVVKSSTNDGGTRQPIPKTARSPAPPKQPKGRAKSKGSA